MSLLQKPRKKSPSSDIFGDTTEISLDAEDKKESEPATVDVAASSGKDESEEVVKSEPETSSSAASVDVTNLSQA